MVAIESQGVSSYPALLFLQWDKRHLLGTKIIYFAIGCLNYVFYVFRMRFFTSYYGFDEDVCGLIQMVGNLTSFGGAALWNNVADWTGMHKFILLIICLGMGMVFQANLLRGVFSEWTWPWLASIVYGLYGLLLGGLLPLTDFQTLKLLKVKYGVSQKQFGRQALFGMLAYGLITLGLGSLLKFWGVSLLFWAASFVSILAALVVFHLGVPDEGAIHKSSQLDSSTFKGTQDSSNFRDIIRALNNRQFFFFFYVVLSTGFGRQTLAIYLPHFMAKELRLSDWQVSMSFAGSCFFSLIFYFISPYALRKLGVWPMFLVGQLALITRLAFYSMVQPGTPTLLIQSMELLNGFAYSCTHVAGVEEASRLAPEGLTATFQGAYACAHVQIPAIFISAIGGYIFKHYGGQMLLKCVLVIPVASAFVLVFKMLFDKFARRHSLESVPK